MKRERERIFAVENKRRRNHQMQRVAQKLGIRAGWTEECVWTGHFFVLQFFEVISSLRMKLWKLRVLDANGWLVIVDS